MPRSKTAASTSLTVSDTTPGQSLVAAARRLTGKPDVGKISRTGRGWQEKSWEFFDTVGEFRYGADWVGNMLSKATLFLAYDDRLLPVEEDTAGATEFVTSLFGGRESQGELLRQCGVHLTVAGELFIVGTTEDGMDKWLVVAATELSARAGKWYASGKAITDVAEPYILRLWRPHPRRHQVANAPARAVLAILSEIDSLTKHVFAQIDSRLAGAGILLLPSELTMTTSRQNAAGEQQNETGADKFQSQLQEAMVTAIGDREDASAMVPIVILAPGEQIGNAKHLTFWSELDKQAIELRNEAIRRLALGLDLPPEIITGTADLNHWCTLPGVRIMTADGWKTYDQLQIGEEVLTLDHETGLSGWEPVTAVNTFEVVDEPMLHLDGKLHSSVTSLNHRWPVFKGRSDGRRKAWTTSGELLADLQSHASGSQRYTHMVLTAPNGDAPAEAKWSDALVEAVAWYFTEGSAGYRPGRNAPKSAICQSHAVNPDHVARITRCLTTLFGTPTEGPLSRGGRFSTPDSVARRTRARDLSAQGWTGAAIAAELGVSAAMISKYLQREARTGDSVPRWRIKTGARMTTFVLNDAAGQVIRQHMDARRAVDLGFIRELTPTQLDLFVDTAMFADGTENSSGTRYFTQSDPARCDAVELAAILAGRYVSRGLAVVMGRSADGPRENTQHVVTVGRMGKLFSARPGSERVESYTGTLWCPTTPSGTWLAEHDGKVFYTGNSSWGVSEEAIKAHAEPLLSMVTESLTTGYLRPLLIDDGMDPAEAERYSIEADTSLMRVRPNRSQEAFELYDRGQLSSAALLREVGFDTTDAPDPEEVKLWFLRKVASGSTTPELVAAALQTLGILEPASAGVAPPAEARPTPSLEDHPVTGPPEQPGLVVPSSGDDGLFGAAEVIVYRALERAGNRLKNRVGTQRLANIPAAEAYLYVPVTTGQLDYLLEDAFTNLDRYSVCAKMPAERLEATLDRYCRTLLVEARAHDPGLLATFLDTQRRTPLECAS